MTPYSSGIADDLAAEIDRVGATASSIGAPLVLAGSDEHSVGARLVAARPHVDVASLRAAGRAASIKRLVLRASRPFLHHQAAFNRDLWDAVGELNHQLMTMRSQMAGLRSELEQVRSRDASRQALLALRLDELDRRLEDLEDVPLDRSAGHSHG